MIGIIPLLFNQLYVMNHSLGIGKPGLSLRVERRTLALMVNPVYNFNCSAFLMHGVQPVSILNHEQFLQNKYIQSQDCLDC